MSFFKSQPKKLTIQTCRNCSEKFSNIRNCQSSYVANHPMLAVRLPKIHKKDHLDDYQQIHPFKSPNKFAPTEFTHGWFDHYYSKQFQDLLDELKEKKGGAKWEEKKKETVLKWLGESKNDAGEEAKAWTYLWMYARDNVNMKKRWTDLLAQTCENLKHVAGSAIVAGGIYLIADLVTNSSIADTTYEAHLYTHQNTFELEEYHGMVNKAHENAVTHQQNTINIIAAVGAAAALYKVVYKAVKWDWRSAHGYYTYNCSDIDDIVIYLETLTDEEAAVNAVNIYNETMLLIQLTVKDELIRTAQEKHGKKLRRAKTDEQKIKLMEDNNKAKAILNRLFADWVIKIKNGVKGLSRNFMEAAKKYSFKDLNNMDIKNIRDMNIALPEPGFENIKKPDGEKTKSKRIIKSKPAPLSVVAPPDPPPPPPDGMITALTDVLKIRCGWDLPMYPVPGKLSKRDNKEVETKCKGNRSKALDYSPHGGTGSWPVGTMYVGWGGKGNKVDLSKEHFWECMHGGGGGGSHHVCGKHFYEMCLKKQKNKISDLDIKDIVS